MESSTWLVPSFVEKFLSSMWPYLKATINGDQLYVDLIDDSAPIPSIY